MARENTIPDEDYAKILKFIEEQGYRIDELRRVPHG
jgi:hypothetical protein